MSVLRVVNLSVGGSGTLRQSCYMSVRTVQYFSCCTLCHLTVSRDAAARMYVCVCYVRGRTIKFANSPPCVCRGSTGQKP